MPAKSSRWNGRSLASAALRPLAVVREDHLAHRRDPLLLEEHVLRPAQADPLRPEASGDARVERRVRVGAHLHRPRLVGPDHQLAELAAERRAHGRHRALVEVAGAAVDRDDVALAQRHRVGGAAALVVDRDGHRLRRVVDRDGAHARDARLAHPTRDDRGVARHASARREDPAGRLHPVDVLGRRLDAHEDDRLALPRAALGLVGAEHDVAARRARARGETVREDALRRLGVERRVQALVDAPRVDAHHRLVLRDEAFLGHVDRDPHRRAGRALRRPALQHVERAALDGELQVLHVAEVLLEGRRDANELAVGLGHRLLERVVDARTGARTCARTWAGCRAA